MVDYTVHKPRLILYSLLLIADLQTMYIGPTVWSRNQTDMSEFLIKRATKHNQSISVENFRNAKNG